MDKAAAKRIDSFLGLAAKAGRVASGEFMTERAVKAGKAHLVIVSGDASDKTRKGFRDMCDDYDVPFFLYGTKESLGYAIGKQMRVCLALTDRGFAAQLIGRLSSACQESEGGGCRR